MANVPTYDWDHHQEAILGTIYLYFTYGCHENNIPAPAINAFVQAHQVGGALTEDKVRFAVQAVRQLDTGAGHFGPSNALKKIWSALLPLRNQFPT